MRSRRRRRTDNDEENEPGGAGFLRGEPESDDEADAENGENGNILFRIMEKISRLALPNMRRSLMHFALRFFQRDYKRQPFSGSYLRMVTAVKGLFSRE